MIEKLISGKKDTTRASSFLPLPAFGYAQETGFEFGLVALYSFYSDRKDPGIRSSSVTGFASLTTKKQSSFLILADLWAPGNRKHVISELRYKNFPFDFYGTGNTTREADKDRVVQQSFRIRQEVEKRYGKYRYAGINIGLEGYHFRDKTPGGTFETIPGTGGKLVQLGASYAIDSRNSNTYTTQGNYIKAGYTFSPDLFGGDNFTGGQLKVEAKKFMPATEKVTVALQVTAQSVYGREVPFYLLPQLGNDQVMRGYYTGRFRDKQLFTGQVELRVRLISRLGLAGFFGGGNVFGQDKFTLTNLKPSYGAGTRYFFDVERGLSIRLDYAKGEKRAGEARQSGFYISLGEAF